MSIALAVLAEQERRGLRSLSLQLKVCISNQRSKEKFADHVISRLEAGLSPKRLIHKHEKNITDTY